MLYLSKIHEGLLYYLIYTHFSNFSLQYQCGFRKRYSVQYCLIAMSEKMKEARDNNKVCAAISQKHLIFLCTISLLQSYMSLRVIHAYINDKIQVTKVGSFYSETLQVIYGVSQGSILGPLFFNANLIDIFLAEHYKSDFSNYGDDTTPCKCSITFLKLCQNQR